MRKEISKILIKIKLKTEKKKPKIQMRIINIVQNTRRKYNYNNNSVKQFELFENNSNYSEYKNKMRTKSPKIRNDK